jgi:hypothetical protein
MLLARIQSAAWVLVPENLFQTVSEASALIR